MTTSPYKIGDCVYLRMRNEPLGGLVTGLIVRRGHVKLIVAWGDGTETDHFDFELSEERPL